MTEKLKDPEQKADTSGLGVISTIDMRISPKLFKNDCPRLFIYHPNRSQGLLSF